MTLPALVAHHHTPTGVFLVVIVALVLVYIGWRSGHLRRLRSIAGTTRVRNELKNARVGPLSFVPLAVLVIVIVVLVIAH